MMEQVKLKRKKPREDGLVNWNPRRDYDNINKTRFIRVSH